MKERKSAAELARMIETRMTLQATVSVSGEGNDWVAAADVFGFTRGAFADRQAKEIADDLRTTHELVQNEPSSPLDATTTIVSNPDPERT